MDAPLALNKQTVARVVYTVDIYVTGLSAGITTRNNIRDDTFTNMLIKTEALSDKPRTKLVFPYFLRKGNAPTMQLAPILKTMVPHPGAVLLTVQPIRAIKLDIAVFLIRQLFHHHLSAEAGRGRAKGTLKTTDFDFIIITHIQTNHIFLSGKFIEFRGQKHLPTLVSIKNSYVRPTATFLDLSLTFSFRKDRPSSSKARPKCIPSNAGTKSQKAEEPFIKGSGTLIWAFIPSRTTYMHP
ncbi:MAG: hypothetical protein RBS53_12005 [Bacteroidales bacterium]|jgi:hypothetical protein|nr:hypothetical protein [Bacteroidales bacterium]